MDQNSFYRSQERNMLKKLSSFLKLLHPELAARFGEDAVVQIQQDVREEFEKLVPQFPDIGGKANPLISNLLESGGALALYRAIQAHGGTVEETGELIHLGVRRRLERMPAFLLYLMGRFAYSRWRLPQMKKHAQASQERKYPDDWVWAIFEGDGRSFDIGIDYSECAVQKFIQHQGTEELMPYLCDVDYLVFAAAGMELKRSKTLVQGCDCCDFRIKK